MTTFLKSVFDRIEKLPGKEQDAIAELLSQELGWQTSFAKSQENLSALAMEAKEEYKKGKTKPMNFK